MVSYDINTLASRLGCKKIPERWNHIYAEAVSIYENGENPLLRPEYYDELHKKYKVFANTLPYYKKAAELISKNEELSLFFCLICRALHDRDVILNDLAALSFPQAPEGEDSLPYDMLTALAICQSYPDLYDKMKVKNIPDDIVFDTLKISEKCVELHLSEGRPRLSSFDWYQLAYDGMLFRIGRLQVEFPLSAPNLYKIFENRNGDIISLANMKVHRDGFALGAFHYEDEDGAFSAEITETEDAFIGYPFDSFGHISKNNITLPKTEWSVKIKSGDKMVGLHIPPGGEPFGDDVVEKTIADSREFMKKYFPEYEYKAFFCASWLVDPTLSTLLGNDANISKFGKRLIPHSVNSAGKSPFVYVYHIYENHAGIDVKALPEKSRLQKLLKKHYLDGNAIYDMHGFFF